MADFTNMEDGKVIVKFDNETTLVITFNATTRTGTITGYVGEDTETASFTLS